MRKRDWDPGQLKGLECWFEADCPKCRRDLERDGIMGRHYRHAYPIVTMRRLALIVGIVATAAAIAFTLAG